MTPVCPLLIIVGKLGEVRVLHKEISATFLFRQVD
jgi:hypothetical protein